MKIPDHLSENAKVWVKKLAGEYVLGEQDNLVLIAAAECWDRSNQARVILDKEGVTFVDRHGHIRPHPATQLERDNRTLFARLIRDLNLPTVSDPAEAYCDE